MYPNYPQNTISVTRHFSQHTPVTFYKKPQRFYTKENWKEKTERKYLSKPYGIQERQQFLKRQM